MSRPRSDPPVKVAEKAKLFPRLFSSLDVGSVQLRNRIVHTATLMGYARNGLPTQDHVDFYARLASGGTALIVTESIPVHPTGISLRGEIHGFDPRIVPELDRIARAVHRAGARVIVQVWHCGRQAVSAASGRALWAPSAVPCPVNREVPKAMTGEEIRELVEAFALTATHAQRAGFDGVEVAAAHGYLIHQFLSPLSNLRDDAYGGSSDNRARFLFEVLDAIRAGCGEDFLVGVRLSGDEMLPGGFSVTETRHLVQRLCARRDVNVLSISAGTHASAAPMVGDWSVPRGNLTHLAAAIREVADVPVIAAGRIVEPGQAEAILEAGQADLVGLSRALLADPDWPVKALGGRLREIRPCIACNECENQLFKGFPVTCAVNPSLPSSAAAARQAIRVAPRRRRVVVVGGGPAGLEAARGAALRGHTVVLLEAADELGGQVRLLLRLENRGEFGTFVRFLTAELSRLKVEVQVDCRVDARAVLTFDPDAVIVATGCESEPFSIPGKATFPVLTVEEAMVSGNDLGARLVLLDAGAHHQRLSAAAEFLAAPGREVYVVTPAPMLGLDISPISLTGILERLRRSGAHVWSLTAVRGLQPGSVLLEDVPGGRQWELGDVDGLIVAGRQRPDDRLLKSLRKRLSVVLAVGDCVAPRGLQPAIREGHLAGMAI